MSTCADLRLLVLGAAYRKIGAAGYATAPTGLTTTPPLAKQQGIMCRGWLEQQQQAPDRVATPSWQGQREAAEGHNNDSLHLIYQGHVHDRQGCAKHMTTLPLVRTRHTQNTPIVQSGTHPETSTAYLMLPHPHTQAATQMAAVCAHTSMQCGQHRAAARYTRTASAPAPTPHTSAPNDRTRHTSMTCPDHLHSRSLTHKHAHGQKR